MPLLSSTAGCAGATATRERDYPLPSPSPSPPPPTTCVETRDTPLINVLRDNDDANCSLRSAIDALMARLGPVLMPVPRGPDKVEPPPSTGTPVIDHINEVTARTRKCSRDIRDLLDALCV